MIVDCAVREFQGKDAERVRSLCVRPNCHDGPVCCPRVGVAFWGRGHQRPRARNFNTSGGREFVV
eukprot:7460489-Alexandrium_andersonii.AAC.1